MYYIGLDDDQLLREGWQWRDMDEGLRSLLRLCRETVARLQKTESALVRSLERDSLLMDRVERLMPSLQSARPAQGEELAGFFQLFFDVTAKKAAAS
jgi:hypothetical protein